MSLCLIIKEGFIDEYWKWSLKWNGFRICELVSSTVTGVSAQAWGGFKNLRSLVASWGILSCPVFSHIQVFLLFELIRTLLLEWSQICSPWAFHNDAYRTTKWAESWDFVDLTEQLVIAYKFIFVYMVIFIFRAFICNRLCTVIVLLEVRLNYELQIVIF